jgi:hypothetical protein
VLLLVLGGLVLAERPALLAGPLTLFAAAPRATGALAVGTTAWLAAISLWVRAHRPFLRGGALAAWCASLPVPARATRAVDLGVLGACLAVALVPFGVAAATVLRSPAPFGQDGVFWCYLTALAAVTLACARAMAYGATPAGWSAVAGTAVLLAIAPRTPLPALAALLAGAGAAACAWTGTARGHVAAASRRAALSRPPLLGLLALQAFLLLRRRWDASLPRVLWALLPLAFDWYLIHEIDNPKPARVLLHLGLAAAAGLLAGCIPCSTRHARRCAPGCTACRAAAGCRRWPTARSSAHARWPCSAARCWRSRTRSTCTPARELLRAGCWYFLLAPLFGVPALYRHSQAVPIKAALALGWLVIGLHTL